MYWVVHFQAKDYPRRKDEIDEMINRINNANADVLWVGLSAPKQEKWIYNNKNFLNVKFAAGVGAVFDFYAGNIKRSPKIFQLLWLEWLPRLIQQPIRLWRRNFVSTPKFILVIFKNFFLNLLKFKSEKQTQ